jgi:hypothetical protein
MQTLFVSVILAMAVAYVGFLAFKKLRGFSSDGSCESGCGKCGTKKSGLS